MRLLDVHSVTGDRLPVFRELHEDGPGSPLRYAILSHTWGKLQDNKEIVFDDIPSSETFAKYLDEATQLKQWQDAISKKKAGFSKITNACQIAHGMGLNYIWIDSCCIDKSKSAELNESINSMYRWYKDSERCIVHLEDLNHDGDLRQCRWFKRGWTLQELVAPSRRVTFYDRNWDFLGETSDTRFCESLSNITGINMGCLQGVLELASLSTAHKMSWAEGRETTVPEDRAYSLMGIFDVNMPLIYGEGGKKAFRRLQEEIARVSSDLSIFAWDPSSEPDIGLDAFASNPDEFAAYKDMVPSYQSQHFTRTNKGIEMRTILWRVLCEDGKERLMLAIGKQKNGKLDIGIILRKFGHNMYMRRGNMRPFSEEQITSSTRRSTFYLASPHVSTGYNHVLDTSRNQAILISSHALETFNAENTAPEYSWDCEDRLFFNNRHWGGSDWRAVELVDKAPAPDNDRRFVALISVKGATPVCYLLRWRDEVAVMFDRAHQTEMTRLEEFRHTVDQATNEVKIGSTGAIISIRLIPTTMDEQSGVQFRMVLQRQYSFAPGIPASVKSTTDHSQSFAPKFTSNSNAQSYQWSMLPCFDNGLSTAFPTDGGRPQASGDLASYGFNFSGSTEAGFFNPFQPMALPVQGVWSQFELQMTEPPAANVGRSFPFAAANDNSMPSQLNRQGTGPPPTEAGTSASVAFAAMNDCSRSDTSEYGYQGTGPSPTEAGASVAFVRMDNRSIPKFETGDCLNDPWTVTTLPRQDDGSYSPRKTKRLRQLTEVVEY